MRVHLFGSLFTIFTYHVPPRRAGIRHIHKAELGLGGGGGGEFEGEVFNRPGFCRVHLCVVWSGRAELSLLLCIFE